MWLCLIKPYFKGCNLTLMMKTHYSLNQLPDSKVKNSEASKYYSRGVPDFDISVQLTKFSVTL